MKNSIPLTEILNDEFLLRDYVAAHLDDLEQGLIHLDTEYVLNNKSESGGAGGRIDVLAKDTFKHIVVIEVKRSNQTAREALHELSKYISLLIDTDNINRENIRCFVVSTKWHELELPLSYFALTAQVNVVGFEAAIAGTTIKFTSRRLVPVSLLPQFSPEFSIYAYSNQAAVERHIQQIKDRAQSLPFVRLAAVQIRLSDKALPYRTVVGLWRIKDAHHDQIETAIQEKIGGLQPYAYPGWEAECDCLSWIADHACSDGPVWTSAEEERGTPEKVTALLSNHTFEKVHYIGDWPTSKAVHSVERIWEQMQAISPHSGTPRTNRYFFRAEATPSIKPSWEKTVSSFFNFIQYIPEWTAEAKLFVQKVEKTETVEVEFYAFDKNHFFYALHQTTAEVGVQLSNFALRAKYQDGRSEILRGEWLWDGTTTFASAQAEIERVHGTTITAVISAYSAVDTKRYEPAYRNHGFYPAILELVTLAPGKQVWNIRNFPHRSHSNFEEFVQRNRGYVTEVSRVLNSHGELPTSNIKTTTPGA